MLIFDVEAARTILVVFAMSFGVVNVDLPFKKTEQLIDSHSYSDTTESDQLPEHQFLLSSSFCLSLEWSLFNPARGSCERKVSKDNTDSDATSQYTILFEFCPREEWNCLPVCFNLTLFQEPNMQTPAEPSDSETPYTGFDLQFSSLIGQFDYPSQPTPPVTSLHHKGPLQAQIDLIPILPFLPNADTSPPSPPTVDQNEYVPSAGSDSGVLLYSKQMVHSIVFSTFPGPWAEWINTSHPMTGITSVTLVYGSLLLLLVFAIKGHKKPRQEAIKKLPVMNDYRKELIKVKEEKKRLSEQLSDAKILLQRHTDIINTQNYELSRINEAGAKFEMEFFNVGNSLSSANYQILSYQEQIKKLEEKLKTQSNRMTKFASKHWCALEKMASVVKRKEELEMENNLIKRAKETTIGCLTALQTKFTEAKNELRTVREERAAAELELCSMADKLNVHEVHLCKQEEEIERLRNCLSQVTSQTAELPPLTASCQSLTENITDKDQCVKKEKNFQLSNVQNTVEEFQDEIGLQHPDEKDGVTSLHKELEDKDSHVEETSIEIEDLKDYVSLLEADRQKKSKQLNQLQLEMKSVVKHFKDKEEILRKNLAIVEDDLKHYKVLEFETQEKLILAEQEIKEEREEWKDLKEQLLSINESLRNQVTLSNDRANEAMKSERQAQQDLEKANKEIEKLKRSFTQAERAAGLYKPLPSAKAHTHLPVQKVLSTCAPGRTPCVSQQSCSNLLNRKVSPPRQFFPLTQTLSTPVPLSVLNHTPSTPSPLLKTSRSEPFVQSDCNMKKRVSIDLKHSSPELTIPYSTHLLGTLSGEPMPADGNVPPQCEMEEFENANKNILSRGISEDCQLHDKSKSESPTTESTKHETTPSKQENEQQAILPSSGLSPPCNCWDLNETDKRF